MSEPLEAHRPPEHLPLSQPRSPGKNYVQGTLLVALTTLLGQAVSPYLDPANLVMPYLLVVVLAAVNLGRGPSIVTAILGALAFDFFLVPPHLTFAVSDSQYLLTFVTLLVVGLVISTLAARAREQAEAARHRETQRVALYALSRELAAAAEVEDILHAIIDQVGKTFDCHVVVLLPDEEGLRVGASSPGFGLGPLEEGVANRCFREGLPVGRGTTALAEATVRYMPLKTARGTVGVLGVRPPEPRPPLSRDQLLLLEAFASQAALAIERAALAKQARQARLLQETEKLQTALLNSISHDLRTPLASVTGALSSLREDRALLDARTQQGLVETAWQEAARLNRLVGNLLDMSRMEAGAMKVTRVPCDVEDVIGVALSQLGERLKERPTVVAVPATLPLVPMDFVLMVQVLVNLLDNALKYSPDPLPIEVAARVEGERLVMEVADHGIGVPNEEQERVFDKFYRVPRAVGCAPGTGLGLSIARGIVEAHGGSIRLHDRPGEGVVVVIALPLAPD